MKTNKFVLLFSLLVALLAAGCAGKYEYHGMIFDEPKPAAEIEGVNYDGTTFRLSDLQGQLTLVFFGYTHCPDVCPFTLVELADAYKQLGEETKDVNVVFVTVDPDRDTPEQLSQYVPTFNPDFYGVYVTGEALETVKSAYGVFAEKRPVEEGQNAANYFVDHTAGIYLIDRKGDMKALFKHDIPAEDLVPDLEHLLKS